MYTRLYKDWLLPLKGGYTTEKQCLVQMDFWPLYDEDLTSRGDYYYCVTNSSSRGTKVVPYCPLQTTFRGCLLCVEHYMKLLI